MKTSTNNVQPKPSKKELIVLGLFYNRFYDLYEELSKVAVFELLISMDKKQNPEMYENNREKS